jgi:hypothetical protein
VVATVAADGSFEAPINGATGQTLRVQVIAGTLHSRPIDLVVNGSTVSPYVPSLPCLTTAPESEAVFGSRTAINVQIRNDCEQTVTLSAVRLRLASTAFSAGDAPVSLTPGSSTPLVVTYVPSGGSDNDILIIETSSPLADRRAVTLFGQ